jgi:hypothetical protein
MRKRRKTEDMAKHYESECKENLYTENLYSVRLQSSQPTVDNISVLKVYGKSFTKVESLAVGNLEWGCAEKAWSPYCKVHLLIYGTSGNSLHFPFNEDQGLHTPW